MTTTHRKIVEKLTRRALYLSTQMIHQANNRTDVEKGDPKVGGHPAACASSVHLLGALHLFVRAPQDFMAVKPHASPMDHAYGHLLGLFTHRDESPFTEAEAEAVMHRLRAFIDPEDATSAPAFQSYHSPWDPDGWHFFPSGSVGIPPVMAAYTALAYRFAASKGFDVPKHTHFWSLIGDSEFREGSLAECMPDVAERELANVTWIVDYNRQNLDGTRIINENGFQGTDADRIERMARANGWNVIQARHGKIRQAFFESMQKTKIPLQEAIEKIPDFELQALLTTQDGKRIRSRLIELEPKAKAALQKLSDADVITLFQDFGGHDLEGLVDIFTACRKSKKPTLVIAHTIKGWGLRCQAATGNHSILVEDDEMDALMKAEGLSADRPFARFAADSPEGKFCASRGAEIRRGRSEHVERRQRNLDQVRTAVENMGGFPEQFGINLKLAPWANTQWMWGQLAARLVRVANTTQPNELNVEDARWTIAAKHLVTMAPDVGTSTNLNPSMDGKIFGPESSEDYEARYNTKDKRRPNLVPLEKESNRHLRFDIEEGNAMSCVGAFGKMGEHLGVPLLPMMTVYDFFIKRALDQLFYNFYWQSSFILVGTPSGVTLSPEGAQHSWKSDLQIPNGITWEPTFALEMDWILADAIRRHFMGDNVGREGVLIRGVTRGLEQKEMLERLKAQPRFAGWSDTDILTHTREDVLAGGYWLQYYGGNNGSADGRSEQTPADYAPGDNVVHLCAMGALGVEALRAADLLRSRGIYANVLLVTSPDLLAGSLGRKTDYAHLRKRLGLNANLFITRNKQATVGSASGSGVHGSAPIVAGPGEFLSLRGARIPLVGICDGEPGLLDNIGSIIGVPQDTLAVRKHSKSGRPSDVYRYHHLDPESIAATAVQMLEQAASEEIVVSCLLPDFDRNRPLP